jgi:toxin ParE1/3/4
MKKPVRLEPEAQAELDEAVAWYDAQTERLNVGDQLLDDVTAALDVIAQSPRLWSLVPGVAEDIGARRYVLKAFPYSLVFLELAQEISVIAFAHGARRPGYWRSRL